MNGTIQQILNQYNSLYQQSMGAAQTQYADVLNGYNSVMNQMAPVQASIAAGYGGLSNDVQGIIKGIGASQSQNIQDVYAQQSGAASQGLINRGLGNTTVANSVQRGLTLDQQKAQVALSNQLAALSAGYKANIGMAGLGYRGQAAAGNQQFAAGMYGAASRVNFPQPNAGPYGAAIGAAGHMGHGGTSIGGNMGGGGGLFPGAGWGGGTPSGPGTGVGGGGYAMPTAFNPSQYAAPQAGGGTSGYGPQQQESAGYVAPPAQEDYSSQYQDLAGYGGGGDYGGYSASEFDWGE